MSPDRRLTRRRFTRALLLASASLAPAMHGIGPSRAGPGDPGYAAWFKHDDAILRDWAVLPVEGDAMRVSIRSKRQPLPAAASAARRRIMVLYPRASSAYDIAITKFLSVFAEKRIAGDLLVVNFGNDDARARAAVEAAEREDYDLILSMGSELTAWLWRHYRGGRLPVISVCSKDPVTLGQATSYEAGSGTNFAFTSLNMPIDAQMAYVHELKPRLKNIAVLVDGTNVSAVETQSKPVAEYARARGIRVLELVVKNPDKAGAELEKLVREGVASMQKNDLDLQNSLLWVTGSTAIFREIATINAQAHRVPVLSVVPEIVRPGDDSAVLSIGISFESNAHLAAVYAADVLERRSRVGALKVGVVSPPDIAINFRKAREIGLRVPFGFFESASTIYDYEGRLARHDGEVVTAERRR